MTEYDINIENYTDRELLNILKIKDSIDEISVQQLNEQIDSIVIALNLSEEYNLIEFIKVAGEKLKKRILKFQYDDKKETSYPLIEHRLPDAINYNQTLYPQGSINPIEKKTITKVINIDSIFRRNYHKTSSSDFVWYLSQPESNVVSMKLSSVDLPMLWYNITDNMERNIFNITLYNYEEIEKKTYSIVIPPGNYDNETLVQTLNNIFKNDNGLHKLISKINPTTSSIIFLSTYTKNNSYFHIDFFPNIKKYSKNQQFQEFQKTIGWKIGFRNYSYNVKENSVVNILSNIHNFSVQGETSCNLKNDNYVFINLDDYNSNCVCQPIISSTWNSYIGNNILARITIDSSFKNTHYDNGHDNVFKERVYLGPVTVEKFKIQILNKFGEIIDLNKHNFSFTLELTKIY